MILKSSVIMFHGFHSEKHEPTPGSISQENLREMLVKIKEKTTFVGPDEFFGIVDKNKTSIDPQGVCLLTFDDSLKSQFDIAIPVLQDMGISALVNVYSGVFDSDKPLLEVFARFRSDYFDDFEDFFAEFMSNLSFVEKGPNQVLKDYPDDYLSLFPFYSLKERNFRYIRDQALTKAEYEKVMLEMIRSKNTSANQIANSLWMTVANLVELVGGGTSLDYTATPTPHRFQR